MFLEIGFGFPLIDGLLQSIESSIFIDVPLRERHFLEAAKFLFIKSESFGESVDSVAVGAGHILRNVITKRFPRFDFDIAALNIMKENIGVLLFILSERCSVYDAVYLFSHEDSAAGQNCYVRKDSAIAKETGYLEDYPDVLGSPETIKGSTILLPMGTGNQAEVDTYLELFGLTEEDVSLVNMDTAPAYQAFVSGEGDMCMTAYPTADEFDPEQYTLAFSMNSLDFPYYDNIIVSREFFDNEANHDALVNLSVQLLRAAEAFQDDELLMDVMLEWYELNGQNVDEASIEHQTLERPFFTYEDFNSIDTTASFRNMAEFYTSIGNITDEDLEKVFANMDDTIIKEALQKYETTYLQEADSN